MAPIAAPIAAAATTGGGITAAGVLTAISAFGAGVSGISAIQTAQFNKDVARRDERLALEKGKIDVAALRRRSRAEQGQRIANIAASGLALEGSPLAILRTSAEQDEFDALLLEQGAAGQAAGFRAEARFEAGRAISSAASIAPGVATSILRSRR